jgi:hypothetical protein
MEDEAVFLFFILASKQYHTTICPMVSHLSLPPTLRKTPFFCENYRARTVPISISGFWIWDGMICICTVQLILVKADGSRMSVEIMARDSQSLRWRG